MFLSFCDCSPCGPQFLRSSIPLDMCVVIHQHVLTLACVSLGLIMHVCCETVILHFTRFWYISDMITRTCSTSTRSFFIFLVVFFRRWQSFSNCSVFHVRSIGRLLTATRLRMKYADVLLTAVSIESVLVLTFSIFYHSFLKKETKNELPCMQFFKESSIRQEEGLGESFLT